MFDKKRQEKYLANKIKKEHDAEERLDEAKEKRKVAELSM
jgi:hypothetical protein